MRVFFPFSLIYRIIAGVNTDTSARNTLFYRKLYAIKTNRFACDYAYFFSIFRIVRSCSSQNRIYIFALFRDCSKLGICINIAVIKRIGHGINIFCSTRYIFAFGCFDLHTYIAQRLMLCVDIALNGKGTSQLYLRRCDNTADRQIICQLRKPRISGINKSSFSVLCCYFVPQFSWLGRIISYQTNCCICSTLCRGFNNCGILGSLFAARKRLNICPIHRDSQLAIARIGFFHQSF